MSLIVTAIRTRFRCMSRESADQAIRSEKDKTLAVGESLGPDGCARSVTVPKILGVDEDMRDWSFYQILEHNVIANRRMTANLLHLAGAGPKPEGEFDVKRDVMPSADPGPEQIEAFRQSVDDHLESVGQVETLRGTARNDHPIFGPFDAHSWNCMFGLHLQVHRKQAEALAKLVRAE